MGKFIQRFRSPLLFLVLNIFVWTLGESSSYQITWENCNYETFKEHYINACKIKRDGTLNRVDSNWPSAIYEEHETQILQAKDMDFYKEIHGPFPAHPQIPFIRYGPVPVSPRRFIVHPQNFPNRGPHGESQPILTAEAFQKHEALADGGKIRKRMLRNAYRNLAEKCCGRVCNVSEYQSYCP